jgi:gamma-glutamylcyclotransferase (GGCT)/AIG2-like uncharacterized protein YtfP
MYSSLPAGKADHQRNLFAYGSLVQVRTLGEVLGHSHVGERLPARLQGYRRVTAGAYPYPYIVTAPDRFVDGVLLMDLSQYDMRLLDRYEEVDAGTYSRELVEVEAWGCGPQTLRFQAFTYVAGPRLVASTAS